MKKLFLIVIALLTTSVFYAQEISYGLKAGVNYGATKTSDADINAKYDPIIAPVFGAYAEIMLTDDFAFQPELLYSPSGSKLKDVTLPVIGTGKSTVKTTVNYIDIPLMAKYFFADNFSLEAGPYIGFLLSAKTNGKIDFETDLADQVYDNVDVKDHFNAIDYGLGVGATYKLDMGLNIGVRYNLGLSDIKKDTSSTTETKATSEDYTMKNNIFQFTVGYTFN